MRQPIDRELREPLARKDLRAVGGVGGASGRKLLTPRERMWAAMIKTTNQVGEFTLTQIIDLAHPTTMDAVSDYVESLAKAKLAEKIAGQTVTKGKAGISCARWRLLVNWPHAPRVNPQGHVVTQGLGVLAMWRAARMRKQFTPNQLAQDATAGGITVSLVTAKSYCLALERSGHFAFVSKGAGGRPSVFRMARDTGPHAPAVTRAKVVFDRNLGQHVVVQSDQEPVDQLD